MMGTLRVIVADDHAVFRQGLAALLGSVPDIELVGEAADGPELERLMAQVRPDVAVVDVAMPGHDLRRLLSQTGAGGGIRVVALTQHGEPSVAQPLIAAGVAGYVLKESAFEELLAAVRAVAAGGRYVSPTLAARLLQCPADAAELLSPREQQVLRLIACGLVNKQIAARLGISIDTVRTHRNRLMEKLGLHTVAELTRYAVERGLVPASGEPGS